MPALRAAKTSLAAYFSLGCSGAARPPSTTAAAPLNAKYVTIAPDVSVSRTAEPAEPRQASLDERADVMAEILAIPPGH